MKEYLLPSLFFKKKWIWFADPRDIPGVDAVTYFSYNDVEAEGFRKKAGWTLIIDLSPTLAELWNNMRKDFIILQIEKGGRKGVVVKQDDNFREFKPILEDFRNTKNLGKEDYRVLSKNGLLFSAYLEGKMIAGGIFIADENNLRVWMLASKRLDPESGVSGQIIGQANRMVLWEAIKYAKEHGMKVFDFCGIDLPEKEGDPLPSLTAYKEAFGGRRLKNYYYTKTYSPVLKLIGRIRNIIRR
ncbi:MAG TPA: GNAT family N-acetyltransferase [Candidatus Paceibacterota bacterium]